MKIKTSELSDMRLDWAVAICKGLKEEDFVRIDNLYGPQWVGPEYSIDWAYSGPIIERERIGLEWVGYWDADMFFPDQHKHLICSGETPLIAAMRCYVASKLGNEVEVPDELNNQVDLH